MMKVDVWWWLWGVGRQGACTGEVVMVCGLFVLSAGVDVSSLIVLQG